MKKLLVLFLCLTVLYASGISVAVSADDGVIVKVGVYENQPKIFTDAQGNVSGFWADIVEYIAAQEGWTIEWVHGTWTECLEKLEYNDIAIMPDVAYSEARDELYDFSQETVYVSWSKVYTHEGTDIQAITDLEGKSIAVLKGSINVEGPDGIKKLVSSFNINCTFIEVDSYLKVFELVDRKEADAGVVSKDFAYNHQDEYNVLQTAIVFQPANLYFAFPQGSNLTPFFIERVDYHVKQLKADPDSIYYQSLNKWFGEEAIEKPIIPEWAKWLLTSIVGLVFLLVVGNLILRAQVRRRTRELVRDRADIKLILDTSPVLIFNKDREGKFQRVNKAFAEALKMSEGDFIGKTVFDLYSRDIAQSMADDDRAVFESRLPKLDIVEQYESAAGLRWVQTDKIPVLDKNGQATALIGFAVDITKLMEAEKELRVASLYARSLIEASLDPLVTISRDGKVTDVNKAAEEARGIPRERIIGTDFSDYFTEPEKAREGYNRVFAEGKVRDYPLTLKHNSGGTIDVLYNATVYRDEAGEVQGVFAAARDITRRKREEVAREKLSEQLKAQVSELETFSYGIAHDLKSPLISIEGFTRLLKEDLQNQKTENVKEDIRLLESGVRKMQGFLQSTLEYSRAGRLIKRAPNVSFSEIINEALQDYNEQISAIGATVSKAKAFPKVNVDRSMIVHVLANLIQNSLKYRNESVPLKIEIGYESPDGEPVFFVRDNGIGIDAGEVGKVFDLFYRGTSHVEGSGIGLKIVKKIIEAHGGKIWVKESKSGKGTTICFTLPPPNGIEMRRINGKD
jgi:PAS domain S-box-containing protein